MYSALNRVRCNGQSRSNNFAIRNSQFEFGSGSVDPAGGTYDEGTVVQLMALADSGWQLDGWSDYLAGSTTPANITTDGNKTITATFAEVPTPPLGEFEGFDSGFTIGRTVGDGFLI